MDSVELLGILDVIRNEKLYNERLDKFRIESEKFKEQKLIVATVEVANREVEKAKKALEVANTTAKKLIEKAEEEAAARLVKVNEKEVAFAKKESEFLLRTNQVEELHRESRRLRHETAKKEEWVASIMEKLKLQEIELGKLKEEYYTKVEGLRKVMGS